MSGGTGGEPPAITLREYIDARGDGSKAQNNARFAEVLSRLDSLNATVQHLEPVSIWKIVGVAAGAVVALAGLLGIMADRFDGGFAASGVLSGWMAAQSERDAAQDAKLDTILDILQQPTDGNP